MVYFEYIFLMCSMQTNLWCLPTMAKRLYVLWCDMIICCVEVCASWTTAINQKWMKARMLHMPLYSIACTTATSRVQSSTPASDAENFDYINLSTLTRAISNRWLWPPHTLGNNYPVLQMAHYVRGIHMAVTWHFLPTWQTIFRRQSNP